MFAGRAADVCRPLQIAFLKIKVVEDDPGLSLRSRARRGSAAFSLALQNDGQQARASAGAGHTTKRLSEKY